MRSAPAPIPTARRAAFVILFTMVTGGCGDDATGTGGTGAVEVTLTLAGVDLDPNGATIVLDGLEERRLLPGVPLTLFDLGPGTHALWVTSLSGNCLAPNNPRPVTVTAGETTQEAFDAVCAGPAPQLTVSKVGVGMVPGAFETIVVFASDDEGNDEPWTALSSAGGIASVATAGNQLTVSGVSLGDATVTVTSASGVTRAIPVRIYDPMVLDVGDLLIAYVDSFDFRGWDDNFAPNDMYWHPRAPAGWRALGSVLARDYEGNPNGKYWAMVVKEDGATGALAPPDGFVREAWYYTSCGSCNDLSASFWTPVCPAGYQALGTVMGARNAAAGGPIDNVLRAPRVDDVACVRANLTVEAAVNPNSRFDHGGAGTSWSIRTPNLASPLAYLAPGAFIFQGRDRTCPPGSNVSCRDPQAAHPVRHVLAVDLPLIIDTPDETRLPSLTGYDQPPVQTVPIGTRTMLVPFTALLGGTDFGGADVGWMVEHSPFVQVERVVYNRLMYHGINTTSVVQQNLLEFLSGVSTTDSETFSQTAGISVTVKSGVSFLGTGGEVSVTASYSFGYESMHSVTALRQQNIVVTVFTPPGKAAAAWQQRNVFRVKRHRGTALDVVGELEFGIDTYVVDEHPDER